MGRFVFSMQSLLNIKEQMENQSKMEYAAAQEALRNQEKKLADLRQQKEDCFEQGRQMRLTTLHIRDLRENKEQLVLFDEWIARQEKHVEHAKEDVEDAREALTRAMQERKTIETLREKAFADFLEEEKAKESKEVDELVSYTYGLRIKENADGGVS